MYGQPGQPAQHGFLLSNGVYTTFDAPGAVGTFPAGINNRAQIVGTTIDDPTGTTRRGFLLAMGAKGPFTPIAFPGAPITGASGIDDRGRIVGVYANPAAAPGGQGSPMPKSMMMSGR